MMICVIGAFDFIAGDTGGQPVKTRELYNALVSRCGEKNVCFVETYRWKKNPFRMIRQLLRNVRKSDVLIMLPAHNGLRVFSSLLQRLKRKEARLYYNVIGGWLPSAAEKDPVLLENMRKLDGIWVETASMQCRLQRLGLEQVAVVPNFKSLKPLTPEELVFPEQSYLQLCTFSRVMEKKGITDAVQVLDSVNRQLGQKKYTLDIYGPVAPEYQEIFEKLCHEYEDFVTYKGVANPGDSVGILKNYFALLFPTKFYTEGIPGTIIDAYAAGIPIVAARWESFSDVVDDGQTGYGYHFGDVAGLRTLLLQIAQNPEMITDLKENCLRKAQDYTPQKAVQILLQKMEG